MKLRKLQKSDNNDCAAYFCNNNIIFFLKKIFKGYFTKKKNQFTRYIAQVKKKS